jgi:hypothetical protein
MRTAKMSIRKIRRSARRAQSLARTGTSLAGTGVELGQAALGAAEVMARRSEVLGRAVADPLRADHAEIARMAHEKAEAAMLAAAALLEIAGKAQTLLARHWWREVGAGARASLGLGRCTTPAGALAVQATALAGTLERLAGLSAALAALTAAGSAAAALPYHRRIGQNASRLAG